MKVALKPFAILIIAAAKLSWLRAFSSYQKAAIFCSMLASRVMVDVFSIFLEKNTLRLWF